MPLNATHLFNYELDSDVMSLSTLNDKQILILTKNEKFSFHKNFITKIKKLNRKKTTKITQTQGMRSQKNL